MFIVPGEPRGKERPRFNYLTKTVYTPDKTKQYEDLIRQAYIAAKEEQNLDGPLKVTIVAYYKIPKNTSKKTKEAMLRKEILPCKKPDADNIIKCLDALNKVAFDDDCQLVEVNFIKFYGEDPRLEITLERYKYND